jgi:transposase-like protein
MATRYSREFRDSLVNEIAELDPTHSELLAILERVGVPRTTFQYWWTCREKKGENDHKKRGRPPAEIRQIVRQEVERGLSRWFRRTSGRRRGRKK